MNQENFNGLHVAAFESRNAGEMARLIERHGGVPHVSPSMREAPLAENRPAIDFAHQLITGQISIVIFLTGCRLSAFALCGRTPHRSATLS